MTWDSHVTPRRRSGRNPDSAQYVGSKSSVDCSNLHQIAAKHFLWEYLALQSFRFFVNTRHRSRWGDKMLSREISSILTADSFLVTDPTKETSMFIYSKIVIAANVLSGFLINFLGWKKSIFEMTQWGNVSSRKRLDLLTFLWPKGQEYVNCPREMKCLVSLMLT